VNRGRRLQDWERQAILDACDNGEKIEAVAAEFGVTRTTVQKVRQKAKRPNRVRLNGRWIEARP